MNTAADLIEELRVSPASNRLFFVWLASGLISLGVSLDISFIPSHQTELGLFVVGVGISLTFLAWVWLNAESRKRITALNSVKRSAALLFLFLLPFFTSFGNLYLASFVIHTMIGKNSISSFTISSRNQGLDIPGRCKHYVRFADVSFFYIKKMCISAADFELIRPGLEIDIAGSLSPLGFRAVSIAHRMQANPSINLEAAR